MNLDELYFKDNFTKEDEKVNLDVNKLTVDCITSKNNKFSIDNMGNLNVQSVKSIQPIIDMIYPVGAYFISQESTNPSNYFGGSWEQIKDKFILACGNTYSNGSTGGEATHKLTIDEMPSHKHTLWTSQGGSWARETACCGNTTDKTAGDYNSISYAGGNQAHNNMPPYIAAYVWKRIA